jgi:hypothetical protein
MYNNGEKLFVEAFQGDDRNRFDAWYALALNA